MNGLKHYLKDVYYVRSNHIHELQDARCKKQTMSINKILKISMFVFRFPVPFILVC